MPSKNLLIWRTWRHPRLRKGNLETAERWLERAKAYATDNKEFEWPMLTNYSLALIQMQWHWGFESRNKVLSIAEDIKNAYSELFEIQYFGAASYNHSYTSSTGM